MSLVELMLRVMPATAHSGGEGSRHGPLLRLHVLLPLLLELELRQMLLLLMLLLELRIARAMTEGLLGLAREGLPGRQRPPICHCSVCIRTSAWAAADAGAAGRKRREGGLYCVFVFVLERPACAAAAAAARVGLG